MKIRIKVPTEINGEIAQPGWVYGVDEPTATAWIANGVAEAVVEESKALRYSPGVPIMLECLQPPDNHPPKADNQNPNNPKSLK